MKLPFIKTYFCFSKCQLVISILPVSAEKYKQMIFDILKQYTTKKTNVILYSDKKMNSSNCKNLKLKMENEEKQLIFIAVPQLKITNETGFVKKKFSTKKLKIVITIIMYQKP